MLTVWGREKATTTKPELKQEIWYQVYHFLEFSGIADLTILPRNTLEIVKNPISDTEKRLRDIVINSYNINKHIKAFKGKNKIYEGQMP